MSTDFHVTITGARGEEWKRITGTDRFPVTSPIPSLGNLPGFTEPQRIFHLDLDETEAAIKEKIVAHLSAKFGLSPEETEAEIRAAGIPILEADCMVSIQHPQKWF